MHEIFPKVNEVFSYHLKNFEVINGLMAAVSLRVQAEEQYERSISKSVQKISQIQTDHPLYSKIIKSFKSLVSERAHQVKFFKQQIAKEAHQLKTALGPIEEQMKAHLTELKTMEKDLRINFDALMKSKTGVEQRFRELDQKFILNEISALYKMNKGMRKLSQSICNEERQLMGGLDRDWERIRVEVKHFESGAQQREKKIWGLDIRVEEEFVDFFKKFNVHQISLIRNIQYDIDNMIKKTDIFNWQNTNEFKDMFNLRFTELLQFSQSDHFADFKQSILKDEEIISLRPINKFDEVKYAQITKKLADKKQTEQFLIELCKNYSHYKKEVYQYIESYRKVNKFKFQVDNFKLIVYIFREVLKIAITEVDFDCIQKIILYGNSYYCPNYNNSKKRTILDQIRGEKTLADFTFWKFYLLYSIRQSVANCLNQKEEKQIHIRNSVYSTLLSNSLSMVECGIQKHNIKNLVGKLAKTFGSLNQSQVAQLLKVVETAYQNMQKAKKPKKE